MGSSEDGEHQELILIEGLMIGYYAVIMIVR